MMTLRHTAPLPSAPPPGARMVRHREVLAVAGVSFMAVVNGTPKIVSSPGRRAQHEFSDRERFWIGTRQFEVRCRERGAQFMEITMQSRERHKHPATILTLEARGFPPRVESYRPGTGQRCPRCKNGAFDVGRISATCANDACGYAIPLADDGKSGIKVSPRHSNNILGSGMVIRP